MANKKITDLPELAEAPNANDLFEIVDISTGESKRIKAQYLGGGTTPTLQEILDNNHDLIDGQNYQGTNAGLGNIGTNVNFLGLDNGYSNEGNNVNALGYSAAFINIGNQVNAFGIAAAQENSADNVNALGTGAGQNNTFKNVNLFGYEAMPDAENQTVFSKWVSGVTKYLARLSFNNITADRKYELPDESGTLALLSDIPTIDATPTDGSTNAVSSNGVFDALALKQNTILIAKKITDSTSLTGTTSEGILETIIIDANKLVVGDILKVLSSPNKTGTAGTLTLRYRINTTNTLSGSTVIATSSTLGATILSGSSLERHFGIRTGDILEGFPFTIAGQFENGSATAPRSTATYNPTQIIYLFITAQLSNVNDSVVNSQYLIQKY